MKPLRILAACVLAAAPLSAQGAFLGVSLENADGGGAAVLQVHEPTAASIMGLQAGDVILAVGDRRVAGAEGLGEILGGHRPGDLIHLSIRREGKVLSKPGILGRRPDELPSFGFVEELPEEEIAIEDPFGDGFASARIVHPEGAELVEDIDSLLETLPAEEAERIRDLIEQSGGAVRIMRAPAIEHARDLIEQSGGSVRIMRAPAIEHAHEAPIVIGFDESEPEEEEIVEEPVLVDVEFKPAAHGWHGDLNGALAASRASGKPVLVDFYADWCGPCRKLGADVLHNEHWASLVGRFEAVQINVDDQPKLAEEYGVGGIPDVRILDTSGRQVEQFVGYSGVETTVKNLRAAAEEHGGRATNDANARIGAERAAAELAAEEARLRARIAALRAEIDAIRAEMKEMRDQR